MVTLGSAGDLHPYLAIGRTLAERGHEVHLLSQAPYEPAARAAGLQFTAVVDERTHNKTLNHPRLWQPIAGFGVLWRHLCVPAIGPTVEALKALATDGANPLRVLASPLAVGARLGQDILPMHLWTGYTAPSALRNVEDPMFIGTWKVPTLVPSTLRHALWRGVDRWKLEPMARPVLTRWQASLGARPLPGSIFGDWVHSPNGGLALYDTCFAKVPERWARRGVVNSGFPLFEAEDRPLPTILSNFLDAGPKPIVIFGGSAGSTAHRGVQALQAAEQLGHRAVLIQATDASSSEAHALNSNQVFVSAPVSLMHLLPRAAAWIHHGGIGSCAQGLASGTQQLVLASAYDQHDNGERLARTNTGIWLDSRTATPAAIVAALAKLAGRIQTNRPGRSTHSLPGNPNLACQFAADHLTQ
ncbi:MAG TPA: nucleotide disphospho-sugar-binding domain-containing protein [Ideonella sp.]|nr:nucleotide disphospho-sugar-binding domain-containing protein [Ideonella sp.]HSI49981.1 nucleotide disphospho-sugar-binding domain-containing protein [Ideonella sp.]